MNVIEYTPHLDVLAFNPYPGQTFSAYVDARFISCSHVPIANRNLYGSAHYSPYSDLAAMIFHTGILFADPKMKDSTHRHFCRVENALQVVNCSEKEYKEHASICAVPRDLQIKGILIQVLICESLPVFPSVMRNGLRSREAFVDQFSMRISNFKILTVYDNLPEFAAEPHMATVSLPNRTVSFTKDPVFSYSADLFAQILSISNALNGLFEIYRLFFDCKEKRYEILLNSEDDLCLDVIEWQSEPTFKMLQKRSESRKSLIIARRVPIDSIHITSVGLEIATKQFSPVEGIALIKSPFRWRPCL